MRNRLTDIFKDMPDDWKQERLERDRDYLASDGVLYMKRYPEDEFGPGAWLLILQNGCPVMHWDDEEES